MRIIVCIKATPANIEPSKVIEHRGVFPLDNRNAFINESDEYAVEEALALKREVGGEVVVICLGLAASQEAIYKALAKGADRALRVDASFLNPAQTAFALAAAIRRGPYDLILTGVESSDVMASYVGGGVAAWLKIPYAFAVTGIETRDKGRLVVTKEIGGGATKKLEVQLPAVLSVQSGIRPLTYTSYTHITFAKRRPVEIMKLGDLRIEEELQKVPGWLIEAVYTPEASEKRNIVMLEGSSEEAVKRLIGVVKGKMAEG